MTDKRNVPENHTSTLSLVLLIALFSMAWVAGGASQPFVFGQVITRLFAGLVIATFVILSSGFEWRRIGFPLGLLSATIAMVLLQLVPLPPAIWEAFPGRAVVSEVANVSGIKQPWRPLSMSPSATVNSFHSLLVPLTALILTGQISRRQIWRLVDVFLLLVFGSCVIGIVQFAGISVYSPFINRVDGAVSGFFANRNHFALMISIGALVLPVWAGSDRGNPKLRLLIAAGLLPLFALLIFASGSRAGILVAVLGIVMGFVIAWKPLVRLINPTPAKHRAIGIVCVAGLTVAIAALALSNDRAVSINRALEMSLADDLRARSFPVVFDMIRAYFPVGAGFGAFDPVYRISEPDELLQAAYFNHAHNDWLEIVLDGGFISACIAITGLVWWLRAGFVFWFGSQKSQLDLSKFAWAALLLIFVASIFDYPARTPMIMVLGAFFAGLIAIGLSKAEKSSSTTR